jgi:hypothetical protein
MQLARDLLPLEPGQAMKAKLQDRPGLGIGKSVGARLADRLARIVDQLDQGRDVAGWPFARQHRGARSRRVRRLADQRDHVVEIRDGDGKAGQGVRPLACLAELELGPAGDHLLAERDEGGDDVAQVQQLGPAAIERKHVDAEGGLQRRMTEELGQNHLGHGVALQLDHHAHAVPVAFVAEVRDALDDLLLDRLGDPLEHAGLVDLVRDLRDHDRPAVLSDLLDLGAAADHDRAAPGVEGRTDAGLSEDDAACREVGTRHDVDQLVDRDLGIVDVGAAGVDHLAQVVGRDVRRHADGDAAGAVDQQVREAGRDDRRLLGRFVVVRAEVDRVLVDVVEQGLGGLGQACLGVAHGRRRVAVHAAEVALAIDQRQPHREVLRHADHGVVDRRIAVRVVLTHHVADDAGGLLVGLRAVVAAILHGVQDAAVDRLEAVAHVREGAAHDHAHGVIEIGAAHLLFDRDGRDVGGGRGRCGGQERTRSGLGCRERRPPHWQPSPIWGFLPDIAAANNRGRPIIHGVLPQHTVSTRRAAREGGNASRGSRPRPGSPPGSLRTGP